MLPNFLIIGAQKSGTTSLWAYLRSHPEVHLSDYKEPGFFVAEMNWNRGLGWYEDLLGGPGDVIALGEASPFYTMYPFFEGVPERIRSVVPHVKLIYVMRDPIERMRSGYIQLLADGTERRPIGVALLKDSRYVALSSYAMQLEPYFECFERSQILLLTAEELLDQREKTMQRVCEFLGVNPLAPMDLSIQSNASEGKRVPNAVGRLLRPRQTAERFPRVRRAMGALFGHPLLSRPMPPEASHLSEGLRRQLADLLRPDVRQLARWMGPSFAGWGLIDPPAGDSGHQEAVADRMRLSAHPVRADIEHSDAR
jgi:hypothetical protein